MDWKFEKVAVPCEVRGETNVLSCRLVIALQMLKELGQLSEYDRLLAKFVKEKKESAE